MQSHSIRAFSWRICHAKSKLHLFWLTKSPWPQSKWADVSYSELQTERKKNASAGQRVCNLKCLYWSKWYYIIQLLLVPQNGSGEYCSPSMDINTLQVKLQVQQFVTLDFDDSKVRVQSQHNNKMSKSIDAAVLLAEKTSTSGQITSTIKCNRFK